MSVVAAESRPQPIAPPATADPKPRSGAQRALRTILQDPRLMIFGGIIVLMVLIAIGADVLTPYHPIRDLERPLQQPSWSHWLGTDSLGRDQLSRVIHGARISLAVAVIAVAIGLGGGVLMGLAAGYVGGALDQFLSRFIDAMLAFPGVLLAIAVTNALGPSLRNAMIAVGIISIPLYFRLTRGQVLQTREQEYITAAAVIGASRTRILSRHILPNIANPLIVAASISASGSILALAALSFIGIGTQPPDPDWGSMINAATSQLERAPWLAFGPGMAIFLTVFSFSTLGDALRDVLDPRLRNR